MRRRKEKGRGKRYLPQRNKRPPLGRKEKDVTHREMEIYKSKRENPVLDELFNYD